MGALNVRSTYAQLCCSDVRNSVACMLFLVGLFTNTNWNEFLFVQQYKFSDHIFGNKILVPEIIEATLDSLQNYLINNKEIHFFNNQIDCSNKKIKNFINKFCIGGNIDDLSNFDKSEIFSTFKCYLFSLNDFVLTENVALKLFDKIQENNQNLSSELEVILTTDLSVLHRSILSFIMLNFIDIIENKTNDATVNSISKILGPVLIEDAGNLTNEDRSKVFMINLLNL